MPSNLHAVILRAINASHASPFSSENSRVSRRVQLALNSTKLSANGGSSYVNRTVSLIVSCEPAHHPAAASACW